MSESFTFEITDRAGMKRECTGKKYWGFRDHYDDEHYVDRDTPVEAEWAGQDWYNLHVTEEYEGKEHGMVLSDEFTAFEYIRIDDTDEEGIAYFGDVHATGAIVHFDVEYEHTESDYEHHRYP